MIRLGAPTFLNDADAADPELVVRAHQAKGYTAAYAPAVKLAEKEKIKAYRKAFEEADIVIAEVGYWQNLLDTDADVRAANRRGMVEALALAEELHARCAVDTLGSLCRGSGQQRTHVAENFSRDTFEQAVEIARYLIDEVQPKTAYFTYEIFPFNVIDSPETISELVRAVDRPQFGVHLDLVNLINCPHAYWASGDIMRQCVRLFGDRIVSAHAKDVAMRAPSISVQFDEVLPGRGDLDIAANLRCLHELPQVVPYMIEHLGSEQEYDLAAAHIRNVAAAEGISL